jgi:hypothetical protein
MVTTDDTSDGRSMSASAAAKAVLGLSACGYPLTQAAIRYGGARGAWLTEGACLGLLARDALIVASGAPRRLRRLPALFLWLELAASLGASVSNLRLVAGHTPAPVQHRTDRLETLRRASVAALFGLHTLRFWIYLQPDQGRRAAIVRRGQQVS